MELNPSLPPSPRGKSAIPLLSVIAIAVILFAAALWSPPGLRTALYLGAPGLIILLAVRQWLSNIENLALSNNIYMQLSDLNHLLESTRRISADLYNRRIEDLYAAITRVAHSLVQADSVMLPILNPNGTFTYVESHGPNTDFMKGKTLPLEDGGLCGWVAKHQRAIVLADLRTDSRVNRDWAELLGAVTAVAVPIIGEGGIIGGITAFRRNRPFTQRDANLLTIFASQIGIALENSRTYASLQNRLEDLKNTQNQLIQSEKMAAIGQMVSGVAHELNNPLTSILGFSEILRDQPGLDPDVRTDITRIHEEAERSRRIIQNLVHFGRPDQHVRIRVDINEILNRTLSLSEYRLHGSNIHLVRDMDPRLPPCMANLHELEQMFLSILSNAEQAILGGGREGEIVVTTRTSSSGDIEIVIRDNGPGILPEHLSRIFDPFFTTKEVGRGTGLGLSIAFGIVKAHQGTIRVESTDGQGAEFIVTLPAAAEDASSGTDKPSDT
ncbi:MAG TPA: ATP-binding protein [Nitrospiria bacterium]